LRAGSRDLTTLGSGSIVQQLTRLGLIDEFSFVLDPIVWGQGKNALAGVDMTLLELSDSRSFENGLVRLTYQRPRPGSRERGVRGDRSR
jgi:dihydrofolate reductase